MVIKALLSSPGWETRDVMTALRAACTHSILSRALYDSQVLLQHHCPFIFIPSVDWFQMVNPLPILYLPVKQLKIILTVVKNTLLTDVESIRL